MGTEIRAKARTALAVADGVIDPGQPLVIDLELAKSWHKAGVIHVHEEDAHHLGIEPVKVDPSSSEQTKDPKPSGDIAGGEVDEVTKMVSELTVNQVVAMVESGSITAAQALEAEKKGQSRATLIKALEVRLEDESAGDDDDPDGDQGDVGDGE